MNIGNNIYVLYKKHSKDVKMDTTLGSLVLYDNSSTCDDPYRCAFYGYTFSGLSLKYNERAVDMIFEDLYGNLLESMVYLDNIFVKNYEDMEDEGILCIVRFVPKKGHWLYEELNEFYGNFIEQRSKE